MNDELRMNDTIKELLLTVTSRDPFEILEKLMALPFCPMHGPLHHVLVGSALLTAYRNCGGEIDLPSALHELAARAKSVPGGACGNWGACGAAISTGQFMSIITGSSPLKVEPWALSNAMTAAALELISRHGGPRCCKRDSYLSLMAAVDFVSQHLGVSMEKSQPVCRRSAINAQCIGERCPFFGGRA